MSDFNLTIILKEIIAIIFKKIIIISIDVNFQYALFHLILYISSINFK
jgi:hypothetical protein